MKLGVGLIVKNEELDLPNCLESITGAADVVCIIDTGSTDKTEEVAREWARKNNKSLIFKRYTGASSQDDAGNWLLNDFSKARNRFVEILDDKVDFILWMDADDVLVPLGNEMRELMFTNYDVFSFRIQSGEQIFSHHRMWRTKLGIHFEGACHEYPKWENTARVFNTVFRIVHKHSVVENQEPGDKRNLRILEAEYHKPNPTNRIIFYYARSLHDLGKFRQAIEIYREYIERPVSYWDEHVFARLYLMRCLRANGDIAQAYAEGFKTLSVDQRFSEVSMELAYLYFDYKLWDKASSMCYFSLQKPPDTQLFLEIDKYKKEPARLLKLCIQKQMEQLTSQRIKPEMIR